MKVPKIQLNFSRLTGPGLDVKAGFIIDSLLASPFKQPIPLMQALQDAYVLYKQALKDAQGLGKVNVKNKKLKRAALQTTLVSMGMWVMNEANGDILLLMQSGYTVVKTPQPRYINPAGEVTVKNGVTSGQIIITAIKDEAANSYEFGVSLTQPTEETTWTTYTSSRSKYTLSGLKRQSEVWVRYAVIGSRNQVSFSNVMSYIVQ